MQATFEPPTLTQGEVEPRSSCGQVIVYDDFTAATTARQMFSQAALKASEPSGPTQSLWKFDVLRLWKMRDLAVEDAVNADEIVIAMHNEEDMPQEVLEWVTAWLRSRKKRSGVLGLLFNKNDANDHRSIAMRALLQLTARRAGMTYVSRAVEWDSTEKIRPDQGQNGHGGFRGAMAPPKLSAFSTLWEHCGLNE